MRSEIDVKRLTASDSVAADQVFRAAFSKQLGYADPNEFSIGYSLQSRFVAEPAGTFGGYLAGQLVAVAFCSSFGSLGVFGPLSVKPELWGSGVGQTLLSASLEYFAAHSIEHFGLTSFPESAKHVAMYHKHGFYPRFLIASMYKAIEQHQKNSLADELTLFSDLSVAQKAECLEFARQITGTIYGGLSFNNHIDAVNQLGIGDTILVRDGSQLMGFAVCHYGPGAEAERDVCYIKLAAVRPGFTAPRYFDRLMAACAEYGKRKGALKLFGGTNTARRGAFEQMLAFGFRISSLGIAMHRPDEIFFDRDDMYVIDDWR